MKVKPKIVLCNNGKGMKDKLLDLETLVHEMIAWCACNDKGVTDDFIDGYLAAIEQRFFGGMREYDRKRGKELLDGWIIRCSEGGDAE